MHDFVKNVIASVIAGFLLLGIAKFSRWFDAWGNKQDAANLKNMASNPVLYADRALRKMRITFCMAGYFLCCGIAFTLYGAGFRPLGVFFSVVGALGCAIAGGYSAASTVEGVNDIISKTRKHLKLPDVPESIQSDKRAP